MSTIRHTSRRNKFIWEGRYTPLFSTVTKSLNSFFFFICYASPERFARFVGDGTAWVVEIVDAVYQTSPGHDSATWTPNYVLKTKNAVLLIPVLGQRLLISFLSLPFYALHHVSNPVVGYMIAQLVMTAEFLQCQCPEPYNSSLILQL